MKLYKVDTIIKGELVRHGLSIHSYVKKAYLALRFMREINFDSAYFIKTVTLTVTSNKVTIPSDFVGLVRIGVRNGQYVDALTPDMNLIDNSIIPDGEVLVGAYWYPNTNRYGEDMGGYFGYDMLDRYGYKILYEDNKILINNLLGESSIVLQYHTDGLATGIIYEPAVPAQEGDPPALEPVDLYIHPYAVNAMIAYIDWKESSEGNRFVNRELKDEYYNELRKYRNRINPVTKDMIQGSLRRNSKASPRS